MGCFSLWSSLSTLVYHCLHLRQGQYRTFPAPLTSSRKVGMSSMSFPPGGRQWGSTQWSFSLKKSFPGFGPGQPFRNDFFAGAIGPSVILWPVSSWHLFGLQTKVKPKESHFSIRLQKWNAVVYLKPEEGFMSLEKSLCIGDSHSWYTKKIDNLVDIKK